MSVRFVNLCWRYLGSVGRTVFSTDTLNSKGKVSLLSYSFIIYCMENKAGHLVDTQQIFLWKQSQIATIARPLLTVVRRNHQATNGSAKGSETWFYIVLLCVVGESSIFFKYGERRIHRAGRKRKHLLRLHI